MATITIPRAGASVAALIVTAGLTLTALPASADLGAPTSTASRTVTRSPSPTPRLTDIRTGRHATFDRVVLDLPGAAPGYRVGYVKPAREDGRGNAVALRGGATLMVLLPPAQAHRNDGAPAYTGSHRMVVDAPERREGAFGGDFEGVVRV